MGGGDPGADNASDDEDNGPEVALFAVHSDNDDSSVSDDDDVVAILDEEEVFGQDTSLLDFGGTDDMTVGHRLKTCKTQKQAKFRVSNQNML